VSATSVPYAERRSRPAGWWGMALFVATEATLFGCLVGSYFYLRFRTSPWPPHGVPEPKLTLPLVLTGLLVSTSALMQLAYSSARRARLTTARAALFVALIVQAGYLAMQLHLFVHDLHEFPPSHTSYSSIYFTMLGTHHAHVLVGVLLTLWLFVRLLRGLTNYRLTGLRAATFYWYFLSVAALVVVGAQLSPRA
jgi:heme/copper-type cytochrome/quinol oxidase subunit 3